MERLLSLPKAMSSPACARRAVRELLPERGLDEEQVNAVQAVVSELVANAVLHAESDVDLFVRVDDDAVRVEIVDYGGGVPTMLAPPVEADRGRGLMVVDALASRWGVVFEDAWKAVWAEFAVELPAAAMPADARGSASAR